MAAKGDKGLSVTRSQDFSAWFSEVIQKAELADLRYNVKGFLVYRPWSVMPMERMYSLFESVLQRKGHKPHWFPVVIPESNLKKESQHLAGFTPEVFWVTQGGSGKLEEPLALRPTSETAFYQMFALWVRSYKQLPFKTYQRAQVFRYETKATRPFLRGREFHWIETHCLFPTQDAAMAQVHEDIATTQEVIHDQLGVPFIFFERPVWDKFPGAHRTFAADALMPDGKLLQLPSTHLINQNFLSAFGVSFKDSDGVEKTPWSTCYGPAISRIFASVVLTHGDDTGLRYPWSITPTHVVFVPIGEAAEKKAHDLAKKLPDGVSYDIDMRDVSPGEKFNTWELKGVPLRVDIGDKELKEKNVRVFRRDLNKVEMVAEKSFASFVSKVREEFDAHLTKQADKVFDDRIKDAKTLADVKKYIEKGMVARCNFCSVDRDGAECAEKVRAQTDAQVRGTRLEKEKTFGPCVACGEKAHAVVYIGRSY